LIDGVIEEKNKKECCPVDCKADPEDIAPSLRSVLSYGEAWLPISKF